MPASVGSPCVTGVCGIFSASGVLSSGKVNLMDKFLFLEMHTWMNVNAGALRLAGFA